MTGPAPLVLFVHGGPFGVRDTWTFNPELQALASRGYAVLQVNFRGSGGYGREFEEAGYRQYGRAMQTDLEDAVAWAVDSGVADRDRVCIYGASYGGYAALMGLVRTPELYACGISLAGPTDLGLLYEEMTGFDPRSSKKPSLKGSRDPWMVEAADRLLGDPWQESEYFHLSSPARRVDRIRSPVMLAHGLSDTVVPIQHHKLMAYRLKRAGKPLVERIQGYEGHNVFAPQNGQRLYEDLLQFLDANIGPGASPDAETARAGD
jgi:dipeptidyl aminopeptidase/acylaminoacyl peptidase